MGGRWVCIFCCIKLETPKFWKDIIQYIMVNIVKLLSDRLDLRRMYGIAMLLKLINQLLLGETVSFIGLLVVLYCSWGFLPYFNMIWYTFVWLHTHHVLKMRRLLRIFLSLSAICIVLYRNIVVVEIDMPIQNVSIPTAQQYKGTWKISNRQPYMGNLSCIFEVAHWNLESFKNPKIS